MALTTFKALKASLASGEFDRVYVFHGADDHLKDENVRALVARATELSTRDFNYEQLRGAECDASRLSSALEALPMLASRRVVVLRDPASLKKPARERLDRYLTSPAAELTLVLVVPSTAKADAKLLNAGSALEFRALEGADLHKWVHHESTTANGTPITDAGVARLAAYGGNDLALLAGELRKLAAYTNGAPIDERAVEAVTGVRPGVSLSDLLERAAARDVAGAIAIVDEVLAQPKNSGVTTVLALSAQLLAIGWGLAARSRGLPMHQMEREFFGLLRDSGGVYTGQSWGEATKCWARNLSKWNAADISRAIPHLVAADAALKDTRVSSEAQVVVSLLLALAPGRARRAA